MIIFKSTIFYGYLYENFLLIRFYNHLFAVWIICWTIITVKNNNNNNNNNNINDN